MSFFASSARRFGPILLALLLCAALASGPLAAGAAAQPASAGAERPFETLALSVNGSAHFNTGLFHEFYRSSLGVGTSVSTPFYAGTVEVGAGLRRYETRLDSAASFWAYPLTLGWGARVPLLPRLSAEATGRVGAFVMNFGGGEAAGLNVESELLLGLGAGLSFRLADRWHLVAGGRYARIYTNPGISNWSVSLGLRRAFRTPEWLQDFLR